MSPVLLGNMCELRTARKESPTLIHYGSCSQTFYLIQSSVQTLMRLHWKKKKIIWWRWFDHCARGECAISAARHAWRRQLMDGSLFWKTTSFWIFQVAYSIEGQGMLHVLAACIGNLIYCDYCNVFCPLATIYCSDSGHFHQMIYMGFLSCGHGHGRSYVGAKLGFGPRLHEFCKA
jgi:hypothetical protein